MKIRLLIILGFLSFQTVGQVKTEEQIIWQTFVKHILDKNADSLVEHVEFPLYGDWFEITGLNMDPEQPGLTKQDFITIFDKIFTPEIVAELKKKTVSDIKKSERPTGTTRYSIVVRHSKIIRGKKDEGAIILQIIKINLPYTFDYKLQAIKRVH